MRSSKSLHSVCCIVVGAVTAKEGLEIARVLVFFHESKVYSERAVSHDDHVHGARDRCRLLPPAFTSRRPGVALR